MNAVFYNHSMDKYEPLWKWISSNCIQKETIVTFETIKNVLGFPIDHSFLSYKKNLIQYGFEVKKISLKSKEILFAQISK
jgi:hypothetical protein